MNSAWLPTPLAVVAEIAAISAVVGGWIAHAIPVIATSLAVAWYMANLSDWFRQRRKETREAKAAVIAAAVAARAAVVAAENAHEVTKAVAVATAKTLAKETTSKRQGGWFSKPDPAVQAVQAVAEQLHTVTEATSTAIDTAKAHIEVIAPKEP